MNGVYFNLTLFTWCCSLEHWSYAHLHIYNKKVKISLHVTKTYERVEIQLHLFLNLAVDEGERLILHAGRFNPPAPPK
jgi:hypothetical protein